MLYTLEEPGLTGQPQMNSRLALCLLDVSYSMLLTSELAVVLEVEHKDRFDLRTNRHQSPEDEVSLIPFSHLQYEHKVALLTK
jgi:hypothetical protein